ncbi:hypothetical protein CYMTET_45960 [Cymbomonas tetramitiformis]|uniref:Carboxypeptidase n=1 Tax=Cymbomonas tetramitiformis TaxID=36881 RepID=A0AAE0BYG1_9CHLO|nr:hypothetical protein CYMTET_45962 [Cymbomonas tetramitiformis]KAK3244424.1 hypothetical protein CYMTET_45960 [Cymbomonas tetramitiformis]
MFRATALLFAGFLLLLGTSALDVPSSTRYTSAALSDEISALPGLSQTISFKQFSGYLEVNKDHGKNIFYWFVESQNDPVNDPVLLWTNGGPGCSGLVGFMTENGPFRPTKDGQSVSLNNFSWNTVANVLFVEQPAGVGFSYSNEKSDYNTGDLKAADDNYLAILQFLERFPQYDANKFYISSESYGGHYMPTLAKRIVEGNTVAAAKINFGGLLVGNPYNFPEENALGMFGTAWGHQLLPKPLYDQWSAKCQGRRATQCDDLEKKMESILSGLNPYSLDTPVCTEETARGGRMQRYFLLNKIKKSGALGKYEPCESNYAEAYLNRADVQKAIHARPVEWEECNMAINVNWNQTDLSVHMEPFYRYLIDSAEDLHIVIYSGDDDSVCGTMGTQSWLYDLGYPIVEEWTPWKVNEQVAGFVTKFKGFNFVTVHTAGHEVPTYQPARALVLLKNYLSGKF